MPKKEYQLLTKETRKRHQDFFTKYLEKSIVFSNEEIKVVQCCVDDKEDADPGELHPTLLDQFRTMENSQLVDKISELNIHLWGDEEPFKGGTVLFGQKP